MTKTTGTVMFMDMVIFLVIAPITIMFITMKVTIVIDTATHHAYTHSHSYRSYQKVSNVIMVMDMIMVIGMVGHSHRYRSN